MPGIVARSGAEPPAEGEAGLIVGGLVGVIERLDAVRLVDLLAEVVAHPGLGAEEEAVVEPPYVGQAGMGGEEGRVVGIRAAAAEERHVELGVDQGEAGAAEDDEV